MSFASPRTRDSKAKCTKNKFAQLQRGMTPAILLRMLILLAVCAFGSAIVAMQVRTHRSLHYTRYLMAAGLNEVLASVATANTSLDALLAAEVAPAAVDMQPAVDAVDALNAKIVAATPAPTA